jgi:hypothetical protein
MPRTDIAIMLAFDVAVHAGLPILLIWLAGRFIGRRTAAVLGVAAIALNLYLIVSLYNICNAPPICPEFDDQGPCHFQCDAPLGGLLRNFIWYGGPISVALLAVMIALQYQLRLRRR